MSEDIVYEEEKRKRTKVREDGKIVIGFSISESTLKMLEDVKNKLRKRGIPTDRSKIVEWCVNRALSEYYYEMLGLEGISAKERARNDELKMLSVEEKMKKMERKLGVYSGEYVMF